MSMKELMIIIKSYGAQLNSLLTWGQRGRRKRRRGEHNEKEEEEAKEEEEEG